MVEYGEATSVFEKNKMFISEKTIEGVRVFFTIDGAYVPGSDEDWFGVFAFAKREDLVSEGILPDDPSLWEEEVFADWYQAKIGTLYDCFLPEGYIAIATGGGAHEDHLGNLSVARQTTAYVSLVPDDWGYWDEKVQEWYYKNEGAGFHTEKFWRRLRDEVEDLYGTADEATYDEDRELEDFDDDE